MSVLFLESICREEAVDLVEQMKFGTVKGVNVSRIIIRSLVFAELVILTHHLMGLTVCVTMGTMVIEIYVRDVIPLVVPVQVQEPTSAQNVLISPGFWIRVIVSSLLLAFLGSSWRVLSARNVEITAMTVITLSPVIPVLMASRSCHNPSRDRL